MDLALNIGSKPWRNIALSTELSRENAMHTYDGNAPTGLGTILIDTVRDSAKLCEKNGTSDYLRVLQFSPT